MAGMISGIACRIYEKSQEVLNRLKVLSKSKKVVAHLYKMLYTECF